MFCLHDNEKLTFKRFFPIFLRYTVEGYSRSACCALKRTVLTKFDIYFLLRYSWFNAASCSYIINGFQASKMFHGNFNMYTKCKTILAFACVTERHANLFTKKTESKQPIGNHVKMCSIMTKTMKQVK